MPEEKLIIIEADPLNAEGFRVDDIQELVYETRTSGPGTVQILTLYLADEVILRFSGADAIAAYALIQDSFSQGGINATPAPIEVTQAAILVAIEGLDDIAAALSSNPGGPFIRVGTDGTAITVTVV